MNGDVYTKQVSLLLDVLPIVGKAKVFALKGGTAINFFFRDCPRLSVDIDLHYLPDKPRTEALADILKNLEIIKTDIEKAMPEVKVAINTKKYHAQVQGNDVMIKLEPNTVIRGTLLPPVEMPLCSSLVKEFNREMKITCVAKSELYAGKLCAALQRQHPRDLFDIHLFITEDEGLSKEIINTFIIYLISQGKPINEMLNPNIHDVKQLYSSQFKGMTRTDISLETLQQVQENLAINIRNALTEKHRLFLIGFKTGSPDWSLLHFPTAKELPAILWKQKNLGIMDKNKRQQAIEKLTAVLNNTQTKPTDRPEAIMQDQTDPLTAQQQIAKDIVDDLISRKLITNRKREQLQEKIATGKLKAEDWSLMVDLAPGLSEAPDKNGGNNA